jgi:hypothetical protein
MGPCLLNRGKPVLVAEDTKCGLSMFMGHFGQFPLQGSDGRPISVINQRTGFHGEMRRKCQPDLDGLSAVSYL